MPIDDFLQVTPVPPAPDLGVPPLGPPPVPPVVGRTPEQDKKRKLLLIATLIGAAVGGRKTAGFGQGMLQSVQQQDQLQQQDQQIQSQQFERSQAIYARDQQQQELETRQRQQTLMQNVEALRKQVPLLKAKADYDRYVTAYTQGLQSLGFRLDANWLRSAAPYVAPSAETKAQTVLDQWEQNPNNKKLFTDHPDQAATAVLPFDRDGDGVVENISLSDLATLAGRPFAQGPDGGLIFSQAGTTLDLKASADGILQQKIAQALADGKRMTPALIEDLTKQSMKEAADLTRAAVAPKGESPVDDSALIGAVMANPDLLSTLTPAARTRIAPALFAQGFSDFGPAPSALERMDARKFEKAAPVLSAIAELSEKINTGQGVIAKIVGGIEKAKAQANLNDDVAEYQALIAGFTPMVARALGHTGVLTQQDVDSVRALFPRPGDSKSLRDRKVARVMSIVGQLQQQDQPDPERPPAGQVPGGLPTYEEYRRRRAGTP